MLILVLAAVHVLRRQEWIAAALLGADLLPIRPFGTLLWLGALGYLIYLRDFFGAGALGGSLVVSWLSWWIGFRNAKREIINGATGISPFEGMSTGLGYIIQRIALATAYLTTGIISICPWVVFALAAFYAVIRYSFRLYPRWARLHYPLMFRWTRFAAQASVRHLNSGQPVDFGPELCEFAQSIYPQHGPENAQQMIEDADAARSNFADEDLMRRLLPTAQFQHRTDQP